MTWCRTHKSLETDETKPSAAMTSFLPVISSSIHTTVEVTALLGAVVSLAFIVSIILRIWLPLNWCFRRVEGIKEEKSSIANNTRGRRDSPEPLLACIRKRRSVFPRDYADHQKCSPEVMHRLLEAAMWAPFHGPVPPWRFVNPLLIPHTL